MYIYEAGAGGSCLLACSGNLRNFNKSYQVFWISHWLHQRQGISDLTGIIIDIKGHSDHHAKKWCNLMTRVLV